jgi:hypothetical protein
MGLRYAALLIACLWSLPALGGVQKQSTDTYWFPGNPPWMLSDQSGSETVPAAGFVLVYPKSGKLCSLDSNGNENCTGGVGGSGVSAQAQDGVKKAGATIRAEGPSLPDTTRYNAAGRGRQFGEELESKSKSASRLRPPTRRAAPHSALVGIRQRRCCPRSRQVLSQVFTGKADETGDRD